MCVRQNNTSPNLFETRFWVYCECQVYAAIMVDIDIDTVLMLERWTIHV